MPSTETAGMQWFAAYVRSRHESRVTEHLDARQVEFFLPQFKTERKWSDRTVSLMLPLFPNYVFVRIPVDDRMRVLEVPGVIELVGARGRPEALEDVEIEQLRVSVQECMKPKPHPMIAIGERVIVTRGPLEGTQGLLIREKSRSRVVIALEMIQQAMSVEVDLDAIAPVNAAVGEWSKHAEVR